MRIFSLRGVLTICALALLMSTPAGADSLRSLMGWPYDIPLAPGLNYASNTPIGSEPIYNRIAHLVYPVLGFPAIIEPGEPLNVFVKFNDPAIFLDPTEWQVRLTTRLQNQYDTFAFVGDPVAQNYDMTVLSVNFDPDTLTYQLLCEVPWGAPEELFHLEVATDAFHDFQPACVKVKEQIGDTFTFVHITDSQVDDPRGFSLDNQFNNFSYPGFDNLLSSQAIFENEIFRELTLLKPDFAVFTGDMIFGMNIAPEIETFIRVMQQAQIPFFMIPGNHDGYAYYMGSPELQDDGLEHFNRILGPQYYSFDVGPYHFQMINSYDGTPLRREAGKLIVASPVDNWGGFLSEEQLNWIAHDLAQAEADGQTTLMFLHHDPRGPYTANKPYPTNPIMGDGDEFWNFESSVWDSNPFDGIQNETVQLNTGTRLLRAAINHGVPYIFIGHEHYDALWQFLPGDPLLDRFEVPVGDLAATDFLTIVQTTSCSAGVYFNSFNGYRLIEVVNGNLTKYNYLEDPALVQSIPAGNFWFESSNNDGNFTEARITVTNGLPTDLDVNLEFYLAGIGAGYEVINETSGTLVLIDDLGLGENGEVVLYANAGANGVDVPLNNLPVPPGQEAITIFAARPKLDNLPPVARFDVIPTDTEGVWEFDAAASVDPEEGPLRYFWNFGDGVTGTNDFATHRYVIEGSKTVTLTVLDQNGGKAAAQYLLDLPDCCSDTEHDEDEDLCGGCGVGAPHGSWADALPMLIALLALLCLQVTRHARRRP